MRAVIQLQDVWKRFPLRMDQPGFKEFILRLPKFLMRGEESYFWALKRINLTVKEGECLGVIGRNGAGKSTLLSLMLGNVHPSRGNVMINGPVTPLLGLGTGCHPDLSGRENARINGVLLGMTLAEIEEKLDAIRAFSGLRRFFDAPVRSYSSGMKLRLGFSIAMHTEPKILLIDEVLSVGDRAFRRKSRKALQDMLEASVTGVLVTHSLDWIKDLCNRAIWLEGGEVRAEGGPGDVISEYEGSTES